MITLHSLREAFHEAYVVEFGMTPKELVKYRLIKRYASKVSDRLKNDLKDLRRAGEVKGNEKIGAILSGPSFLERLARK